MLGMLTICRHSFPSILLFHQTLSFPFPSLLYPVQLHLPSTTSMGNNAVSQSLILFLFLSENRFHLKAVARAFVSANDTQAYLFLVIRNYNAAFNSFHINGIHLSLMIQLEILSWQQRLRDFIITHAGNQRQMDLDWIQKGRGGEGKGLVKEENGRKGMGTDG